MKFGKNILLFSALSVISLAVYAVEAPAAAEPAATPAASTTTPADTSTSSSGNGSDIVGNYQCQGYDPYGKSNYSNPVTVTRNGDTYSFQWLSSKGYPFILGTGVFNKNIPKAISVVFWDPKKQEYFGTEFFEIKADGSLQAYWTLQGENLVGTETCTKSNK